MMKSKLLNSLLIVSAALPCNLFPQNNDLFKEASKALEKGADYFYSINTRGGYAHNYNLDLSIKWGEDILEANEIEIEPPGTPSVGEAFLKAYDVTGMEKYLKYAEATGYALIDGQNSFGGWDHTIDFDRMEDHEVVSLDDNHTQSAISFLIKLSEVSSDTLIHRGLERALNLMLECQFENGAWPHLYPKQGNYHDYATFNDGGINNCVELMMEAYASTGKKKFKESIKKAGYYIYISQYHPPQTGWAQQYNEFLQPVWARTFEPPSLSALVTIRNIYTLLDIYLLTEEKSLLDVIPDAFNWLESIKLENGKYPRFVELGTNKPLYYDRGRKQVNSVEELSVERRNKYGYEQDLESFISSAKKLFKSILAKEKIKSVGDYFTEVPDEAKLNGLVQKVIDSQETNGSWIKKDDNYRKIKKGEMWDGVSTREDRISSRMFIKNLEILTEYIRRNK
ncbi:MAG: pectate lyase [Bacteroidetes bacterium]|nr:pectate lyase [Bacteroidota bacterium]